MSQPSFRKSFTKLNRKAGYDSISPTHKEISAKGKTITITAGHTGIGYSIAENFAIAGAAHVIIIGRRLDVLESARDTCNSKYSDGGTTFHSSAASITDQERIHAEFQQIRQKIGKPDVLVTSAAHFADSATMLELPLRHSLETNVLGNLNLVHEFVDSPFAQGGSGNGTQAPDEDKQSPDKEKTILDVSAGGIHAYVPKGGAYSISKMAFSNITRTIQIDALTSSSSSSSTKLRVHSFHPGIVLAPAVRGFGWTEDSDLDWDDVSLPGQFAVWFVSPEAEFLKGRFVWANWDVDELLTRNEKILKEDLLKIGLIGRAEWDRSF